MAQRVLEHDRAAQAHAAVEERWRDPASWKKYRTIALKLPVMVHNHGLAPALHFVAARSKGEEAQKLILDDLAKNLHDDGILPGGSDRHALLAWSRGLKADALRLHTREILRRLGWYKRMVQARGKEAAKP